MAILMDEFRAFLLGRPEIAAIIAKGAVYEDNIPQAAPGSDNLPAIVITRDSTQRFQTFDGGNPLRFVSVRIECKAGTKALANSLARVVEGIDGYTGPMGALLAGAILLDDESDSAEPDITGGDDPRFVATMEATIQYLET